MTQTFLKLLKLRKEKYEIGLQIHINLFKNFKQCTHLLVVPVESLSVIFTNSSFDPPTKVCSWPPVQFLRQRPCGHREGHLHRHWLVSVHIAVPSGKGCDRHSNAWTTKQADFSIWTKIRVHGWQLRIPIHRCTSLATTITLNQHALITLRRRSEIREFV